MSERYTSYDYKKVHIQKEEDYTYLDALSCFGWDIDNEKNKDETQYVLKRKRQISNKIELLRLENNLEACRNEIKRLQQSSHTYATMIAIIIGLIGTVFITLSTFAIVVTPPNITLCVVFAIPGCIGWILPCFSFKLFKNYREKKTQCFLEAKEDEIDQICDKASKLML